MNNKEYIASGAIEAYVMGMATPEEAAELEQRSASDPEVREALRRFEKEFENVLQKQAITPPDRVRQDLQRKLAGEFTERTGARVMPSPARWWRNVAAAVIVLLLLSAGLNFYFYRQYRDAEAAYAGLIAETRDLHASNRIIQTRLTEIETGMKMMSDPVMQKIQMAGTDRFPDYTASIYWNTKTRDVYLVPTHLPSPTPGKQYQLWAIVDGKPVSAGLMEDCPAMCKMSSIEKAEAFAITLEKKGGSIQPTLDQMYVMGTTAP